MNTRVGTGVVILAAAVLATLGACSGEAGEDGSGPKPTTTPQARRENIVDLRGDPAVPDPLKFDPRAAHVLPTGVMKFPPIALHGRAAWLSHAAGLTVYDLGTGKVVSDIETENTPTYDVPAPAKLSKKQAEKLGNRVPVPEPVQINGVPAVVTVVPVKLAAKDGGEEHAGFEVIAARADNGKLIWRLPVDVYGDPAGELGALQMSSSGDTVAVAWTVNGSLTGTFAFTLDKPRMVWQRSDFLLIGGYGEALIGFRIEAGQDYSLAGAAIADGRDLWHKRVPDGTTWAIREGGGPLVKLDDDTDQAQLIEIATGDVAVPKKAGLVKAMACDRGEGGTVMLCASKEEGAIGVDDTGKILWRRPAGDGANEWNAATEADFKDLSYVKGEDGPFVVDARTGRTVGTDPGIVPDRVNAYAALVFTGKGTEVHHASR